MKLQFICLLVSLACANLYAQVTDIVTGLSAPNYMCLDGNNMYVSGVGSISVFDITDTNPTPTAIISNSNEITGIAIQGSNLYYGEFNTGSIFVADLSQSPPTIQTFASGLLGPNFITIKDNYLYCSETQGARIVRFDLNNPVQEIVVANINIPIGLAFQGNDLYYSGISPTQILKKDISDLSNPSEVIISGSGLVNPNAIQLIGDELFIPDFNPNTLYKLDITENPSTLTTVVDNVSGPKHSIQVGTDLYLVLKNDNKIVSIDDILSVPEFESSTTDIRVFPNPSSDFIQLTGTETVQFELFNITGQSVMKGTFYPNQQVSIAHLQKGVYLLNFENGSSKKIIKL